MCVRRYEHQVPYGVVNFENQALMSIDEKPTQKMFVNAGIYVLDPKVLTGLAESEYYDMNELFDELMNKKEPVSVFPIREYWLDIGRVEDFDAAHGAYQEFFSWFFIEILPELTMTNNTKIIAEMAWAHDGSIKKAISIMQGAKKAGAIINEVLLKVREKCGYLR